MNYLEGFLIGFLGSIHCIGMCGPIALLLPSSSSPFRKFIQIITYNSGRVISYASLGVILGIFGASFRLAHIQQYTSIAIGLILIFIVLLSYLSSKENHFLNRWIGKFFLPIQKKLGIYLGKNRKNLLYIGILNGFLPCGLVYFALAGALTTSSISNSILFMMGFGFGTIPAMLVFSYTKDLMSQKIKIQLLKIVPIMLIIMGLLLITRGLDLGIPYLSPKIEKSKNKIELKGCCSQKSDCIK